MKMKHINKYIAVAAIGLVLASCEDKTEYVAAQPDSPDCIGVYFDENNPSDFLFIPGESSSVELLMHRLNTSGAVDVPIIGSCTAEGMVFPDKVHFDAGQPDATILIDCAGLPLSQKVTFSVNIPDEYINHYAATLFNYESSAIVSSWEPANTDGSPVTFYFVDRDCMSSYSTITPAVYQPVECEMEVLPGAGKFRVYNFVNSGIDMTFELSKSPYDDFSLYYRVSPLDNMYSMQEAYESDSYGDSWYNAWFLYDDDLDDYAELDLVDLDGKSSVLSYPFFFWYSDAYVYEYAYMAPKDANRKVNCASIGLSGTPEGNLTLPSYFYIFFKWDGPSGL